MPVARKVWRPILVLIPARRPIMRRTSDSFKGLLESVALRPVAAQKSQAFPLGHAASK